MDWGGRDRGIFLAGPGRMLPAGTLPGRPCRCWPSATPGANGEKTPAGESFVEVEVYDPTTDSWSTLTDMPIGRHGAVWGRIGSAIFVATGGPTGGSAFTADVDVLRGTSGVPELVVREGTRVLHVRFR